MPDPNPEHNHHHDSHTHHHDEHAHADAHSDAHHDHPHNHATSPRTPSVPISAAQLNNSPAPLPPPLSPPMSPPPNANPEIDIDTAYLDKGEEPQHPTVAETGAPPSHPLAGPGPMTGQLKRRESDAKRRIIRLASFGGEGLVNKPVEGEGVVEEEAIAVAE